MGTSAIERVRLWMLPAAAKSVLVMIAHHHNDSTGVCHPSIATLAAGTCLHRATVQRAVVVLRKRGAITVTKGPRGSFHYTISASWTGSTARPVAQHDRSQPASRPVAERYRNRSHCATQTPSNTNEHLAEPATPPGEEGLLPGDANAMPPVDAADLIGPDFPLRNGAGWRITKGLLATLVTAHPHADHDAELAKAASWCVANPTKQKSAKGMPRFLNGWLQRCQPAERAVDYDAAALAMCRQVRT